MTSPNVTIEDLLNTADTLHETDEGAIDAVVVECITRIDSETLTRAILPQLRRLQSARGVVLVRLVEATARTDLYEALADGLAAQLDVAPSLALEALDVLEGTGCIEARPTLVELRADLDALYNEEATLQEFADQIENEPEDMDIALEAVFLLDPPERDEILDGLAGIAESPNVREFLRRADSRRSSF